MKTKLLYILLIVFSQIALAQQQHFDLDWQNGKVFGKEDTSIKVPYFSGSSYVYSGVAIGFGAQWSVTGAVNPNSLVVNSVKYENISVADLFQLDRANIATDIDVKISSTTARTDWYAMLTFNPIVYSNGIYKKVLSVDVSYSYANNVAGRLFDVNNNDDALPVGTLDDTPVPYVAHSVLASGRWYKFYVEESGVFRINRQFLSSLGINLSGVDPRTIKVYGYGGEMLPLLNNDNAYFDLPEIPIQVVGEADGSFDSGDYILFYGTGPHEWNDESQTSVNLYNDITYYYITYGGEAGKRVTAAEEITNAATTVFTTYDDYQYHEEDLYNIVGMGRRWFGELFNVEAEQTFNFDLTGLDTSENVTIGVKAASVSSSPGTSFSVKANDASVMTLSFSAIDDNNYATQDPSGVINEGTRGLREASVSITSEDLDVTLSYSNAGVPSSLGYLDYIAVQSKRFLAGRNSQFNFRVEEAASLTGVGAYQFTNASHVRAVWDVTDMYNVTSYSHTDTSDDFSFKASLGAVHEYVVIDALDYKTPSINSASRTVDNQDLKGNIFLNNSGQTQAVEYVIVTPAVFEQQAEALADIHRNRSGMVVKVVDLEDIYKEFSTGNQDIGAIRNFIRYMYYNAPAGTEPLKYVCLFGDGSYDYKNRINNNSNFVPLFHNFESFSTIFAYCSDDFYGMMDPEDGRLNGFNSSYDYTLLDVAVGRIVADNVQQAAEMVNKVKEYYASDSFGRWRNNLTLLADDVDQGWEDTLQTDLNNYGDEVYAAKPFVNLKKIYLDSYVQQTSAGGERYPDAKEDLIDAIDLGTLVIDYFGHGGEAGLSSERVFQLADAQGLSNIYKYFLFITVTCDFTRFDNPEQPTAGEYTYWNPEGGAIGLMATTRKVLAQSGSDYNQDILRRLYAFDDDGNHLGYARVGEVLRRAKSIDFLTSIQKRVICYVGDPALEIAIPGDKIVLTHVNDVPITEGIDTLNALGKVKLKGNVVNSNNVVQSNYNGTVYAVVYDKNIDRTTLGNDGVTSGGSLITLDFETLGEVLFRGKATVTNGAFEFEFVVPRDALIPISNGRISFYAYKEDFSEDQTGYNTDVLIGGLNENAPADNEGPEITLYMNDENFLYGGFTNQSPILLAYLEDENGINTSSGIGHDIIAILDGDEANPYVLNDYYETELNVYTNGLVNFPFSDLEPGVHTLTFKAWDTYNNSSTAELQFVVIDDDEMKLDKVLNYPNPFVSYTEFWFQHNKPMEPLEVQVQVFTVSGKLVWTHNQTVTTEGYLSRDITWDGRDDFGDKIGKGTYVYKITVKSTLSNKTAEKSEILVIL